MGPSDVNPTIPTIENLSSLVTENVLSGNVLSSSDYLSSSNNMKEQIQVRVMAITSPPSICKLVMHTKKMFKLP
ncbi:hypothetical protein ES332_D06G035500v1 [Gossypium tomentosum]|uniref:Uncharacterized protein n=1 Tax=Gossypium tomentosum TaxID=34277 RepID=A0A5D2KED6_GOSTO|nr:hypothetical protein ES332_D06G035500v1 [Gossypium tomentosum]